LLPHFVPFGLYRLSTKIDLFLKNFLAANPAKSMYGFTLNRKKPGHFNLCFLANKNSIVQTWVRNGTTSLLNMGMIQLRLCSQYVLRRRLTSCSRQRLLVYQSFVMHSKLGKGNLNIFRKTSHLFYKTSTRVPKSRRCGWRENSFWCWCTYTSSSRRGDPRTHVHSPGRSDTKSLWRWSADSFCCYRSSKLWYASDLVVRLSNAISSPTFPWTTSHHAIQPERCPSSNYRLEPVVLTNTCIH